MASAASSMSSVRRGVTRYSLRSGKAGVITGVPDVASASANAISRGSSMPSACTPPLSTMGRVRTRSGR